MADEAEGLDVFALSPDEQLRVFNRTSLLKTLIYSLLLHVVVIGGLTATSLLEPAPEEKPAAAAGDGEDGGGTAAPDEPDGGGAAEGTGAEGAGGTDGGAAEGAEGTDAGDGEDDGDAEDAIEDSEKMKELKESEDPITDPGDDLPLNLGD